MHTRPPSIDPNTGGGPDRDGAYNVRSVPVRIYLPDGPIIQDLVPPVLEDGPYTSPPSSPVSLPSSCVGNQPFTHFSFLLFNSFPTGSPLALGAFLTQHLPLLFPASESDPPFHDLAHPLVQGVPVPKDADMAWLGACMAGADGWVNVCIALLRHK